MCSVRQAVAGCVSRSPRGFETLVQHGHRTRAPAVECVQPEGNNTMAGPLRDGAERAAAIDTSTTRISGLQVPNINDGHLVVKECRATGGTGHIVADEPVWEAQKRLAQEEGIFSEPAGAVALAGALQAVQRGEIDSNRSIVCLVTGSGFKDEESVSKMLPGPSPLIELTELEHRGS